jgi:hypothetical protein
MTSRSSSHTDTAVSARELAALGAQVADLAILHVPHDTARGTSRAKQNPAFGGDGEVRGSAARRKMVNPWRSLTSTGRAMPVDRTSSSFAASADPGD